MFLSTGPHAQHVVSVSQTYNASQISNFVITETKIRCHNIFDIARVADIIILTNHYIVISKKKTLSVFVFIDFYGIYFDFRV